MRFEFEESYQLKVNYSCEYEVDDKHPKYKEIKINCRFLEYFPLCRDYVDTSPIYFTKKPSQEEARTFRYGPAEWLNFEIIKDFAWESKEIREEMRQGKRPNFSEIFAERSFNIGGGKKNEDGSWLWRTSNPYGPYDHAIIAGFRTTLLVSKERNIPEEDVNQAVKEIVENSVALITHSPLVKLYRKYEHIHRSNEAGIIIDSKSEWIPSFNYHKNMFIYS